MERVGHGLKMRFKNMHTGAAPLRFVDEKEAINYILQAICRDEITTSITYHQSKEKLTVARFFFAVRCLRATKVAGGALQSAE